MHKRSEEERVPFNGIPIKEGEVLVPMLVDEDFIRINEVSEDKIRRWGTSGIGYKVAFYAVPEEYRDMAMSQYNSTVNDMLDRVMGANRHSRCLIPQPDGSLKACPKKRGDNHPACKDCPNRGKYEKEDKATLSLDAIRDQFELEFPAADDVEKAVLLPITLMDLMEYLRENDERAYLALMLRFRGLEKKAVVMKLMRQFGLGKSQAYFVFSEACRKLNEYINM